MKPCIVIISVLLCASSVLAGNLSGEYESRTSVDKVNLWCRTHNFEVYVLKNANLQIDAGPRFHLGPLAVTAKLGGIWKISDSTVTGLGTVNLLFRHGRLACLSVNTLTFEDVSFSRAYQEGYVLVDVPEITPGLSLGLNFEYYQVDERQKWVVGPRLDMTTEIAFLKSVSVWVGVTDNPTAAVFFSF